MELDTFIKCCEVIKELNDIHNKSGHPPRPSDRLALHQFGEALIHPRLEQIFEILRCYDLWPSVATNTKVLQSPEGDKIIDLIIKYDCQVDISEHLFKGPKEVHAFVEHLKDKGVRTVYPGTATLLLDEKWGGKEANTKQGFVHHEWLKGDKIVTKEHAEANCGYLVSQMAMIQANGTVVSCCADAEGDSNLGNVLDPDFKIENVVNKFWKGCETCTLMQTYYE